MEFTELIDKYPELIPLKNSKFIVNEFALFKIINILMKNKFPVKMYYDINFLKKLCNIEKSPIRKKILFYPNEHIMKYPALIRYNCIYGESYGYITPYIELILNSFYNCKIVTMKNYLELIEYFSPKQEKIIMQYYKDNLEDIKTYVKNNMKYTEEEFMKKINESYNYNISHEYHN